MTVDVSKITGGAAIGPPNDAVTVAASETVTVLAPPSDAITVAGVETVTVLFPAPSTGGKKRRSVTVIAA